MTTTTLDLKVTADARSAVSGLKPLQTSLEETKDDAHDAERALKDLGGQHKIKVDNDAVDSARKEIKRLRDQMREDLRLDVNADTKAAQRRIRELSSSIKFIEQNDIDMKVDVDDSDLRNLDGAMVGIGSAWGRTLGTAMTVAFGAAAGAITPIVVGVGGLVGITGLGAFGALKLADEMDNAKIAFEQFLGGAKPAETFLSNLSDFAASSPFEFPELVDASKQLLAYGTDADDIISTLTTLGDTAGITGSAVSDLTTIWGQMQSSGTVANEDLKQFQERGIDVYGMLAKDMGLTVAQVKKLSSEGKLMSEDVMPILQKRMNDTFGGGMAKQAATLSGKMSTLKDTLSGFGREVGAALMPIADALVAEIQPKLEQLSQWAAENKGKIAESIMDGIAGVIDGMAGLVDAFAVVVGSIAWLVDSVRAPFQLMGGFLDIIGNLLNKANDIPGVGAAIPDDLGDSLQNASKDMLDFGKGTSDTLHGVEDSLHGTAETMRGTADSMRAQGDKMADAMRGDEITAEISRVKGELDDLQKKPRTAKVDADIKDAQAKLRQLRRERREWAEDRSETKLDANISGARKKLKDWRGSLRYLRTLKPTTQVKADIKEAQAKIREFRRQMREAVKKRVAPIDAKITGAQGKAKSIRKTLADLGKKKSTPKVEAKTKAAQDALKRVQTRISNLKKAKANVKVGVKANTSPYDARLKAIQGKKRITKIDVTAPKANATKAIIDGVASKKRTATIGTDVTGEDTARTTLDTLAKDRTSYIYVRTVHLGGGGGGGGGGPSAGGQSLVPQLFGTDTAQVAGLRAAAQAAPQLVAATPYGVQAPSTRGGGTVTQLVPRQVPIKVFLDGQEIADHLTLKAGRLGTTSSARRRA